jgi:hypothetical protein
LNAETICGTLLDAEPVHWYEQPSSEQASEAPYWVGVKNGFVVTWLTIVNLYVELTPKIEPPEAARAAVDAKAEAS